MIKKIKSLQSKHREIISYLFFGVLTTIVNFLCFYLFSLLLGEQLYLLTNVIAWIIAVAFAYLANKLFVFKAMDMAASILLREIMQFVGARIISLIVEELGLFALVDLLGMGSISLSAFGFELKGQMIAKIILAVIVVILNYIFSKAFIFKVSDKG